MVKFYWLMESHLHRRETRSFLLVHRFVILTKRLFGFSIIDTSSKYINEIEKEDRLRTNQ